MTNPNRRRLPFVLSLGMSLLSPGCSESTPGQIPEQRTTFLETAQSPLTTGVKGSAPEMTIKKKTDPMAIRLTAQREEQVPPIDRDPANSQAVLPHEAKEPQQTALANSGALEPTYRFEQRATETEQNRPRQQREATRTFVEAIAVRQQHL